MSRAGAANRATMSVCVDNVVDLYDCVVIYSWVRKRSQTCQKSLEYQDIPGLNLVTGLWKPHLTKRGFQLANENVG